MLPQGSWWWAAANGPGLRAYVGARPRPTKHGTWLPPASAALPLSAAGERQRSALKNFCS